MPDRPAHAALLDGGLSLPAELSSVRTARRIIASLCTAADLADASDDAQLLTSELVTNALVHGYGTVVVRARLHPGQLRVEVQDDNPVPAHVRHAAAQDEGGRGIDLLQTLAASWGVHGLPLGKYIWFTLRRPAATPL